ncbi:MAG: phage tail protein [Saprospiraceae bacterium]|nr:phage tail protein [Saprospiraceae bacterium]
MAVSLDDILLSAFNFKVEFSGIPGLKEQYFQEVSGLSWEMEVEDLPAGGVNEYSIRLPRKLRYPNLMLKRAMYSDPALVRWMEASAGAYFVNPTGRKGSEEHTDILISLLNHEYEILVSWQVLQAFPLKWNLSPFNAMDSKLIMETFEFGYKSFKRL